MIARRTAIYLLFLLLFALTGAPLAAAEISFAQDGWYHWEVPAGAGGRKACCYNFRSGDIQRVECGLGDSGDGMVLDDDCDVHSDTMRVYVEVRDGRVREIQPLSSACPVRSGQRIHSIEDVSTGDSIDWLMGQVENNRAIAEEAVMTISFHSERHALQALVALLEDSGRSMHTREQALFWMVQSGSDEAFAYLDRLLDR